MTVETVPAGTSRVRASLSLTVWVQRSFHLVLVTVLLWQGVWAQAPGATLAGEVVDSSGAVVPGAQVAIRGAGGSGVQTLETGSDGRFQVQGLSPGRYEVRARGGKFAPAAAEVTLEAGDWQFVTLRLAMPSVSQQINVSASPDSYVAERTSTATKTDTPLIDVPQAVAVVTRGLIEDQAMSSMAEVVRYMPGITAGQGEGNRDQMTIRGNSTTADFFVDGVRDDVQYYRDLYNVERVEALKGPNALIFGRGGGGGVLNRVSKTADWNPVRELVLRGGSYENRRVATDLDQAINGALALRFNGMYEDSGSFRNYFNLERYGLTPAMTLQAGERSKLKVAYEHFKDGRVADRGIPSFQGRPSGADISTFFGDPEQSRVRARVDGLRSTLEHQTASGISIRNHSVFADYDKFYQNVFPGAVNADQTLVSISGYNNASQRRNLFHQTDVSYGLSTGGVRHTLAAGVEVGRQSTSNFRNTAYFYGTQTSVLAPFSNPTIEVPVSFRQSASDADNHVTNYVAAGYVQDQVQLSRYVQVLGGLRYDYFDLNFRNNRKSEELERADHLVSPRLGLVLKPAATVSVYSSYSVSYLPSAGDQFSSLNATTQTLRPEKFSNYEVGAKWDFSRRLGLTAAVYQLDRTNTTAPDPNQAGRIVQTGRQRTRGLELSLNGSITRAWEIASGYAYQSAHIARQTTAAPAGASVPLVPSHSLSLWNKYRVHRRVGFGLGIIHQEEMYAAIDNKVVLPRFTRADAAVFLTLSRNLSAQVNLENVLDRRYYPTAHNNNNISPGSPRVVSVLLKTRF